MAGLLIVGKNDCPLEKVVGVLESKSSEVLNWADVAGSLGVSIPVVQPCKAEKEITNLEVQKTGLIQDIIEEWGRKEGECATLGYLIRALKSTGSGEAAESLMNEFKEEIAAAKLSRRFKSELITPDSLFWAVDRGEVAFVEELVRRGADVNWKYNVWETSLHRATMKEDFEVSLRIIKCLVSNEADLYAEKVEIPSGDQWTFFEQLLPKLTPAQFHEFCEFLLQNGKADYFSKPARASDRFKTTPIQLAVKSLDVERRTLKLLKEEGGVNFNKQSYWGTPLLNFAVEAGRSAKMITDLIETCGLDPYQRRDGKTLYDELAEGSYKDKVAQGVMEVLKEFNCYL